MGEVEGEGIEMRPRELEGVVGFSGEVLPEEAEEIDTERARPLAAGMEIGSVRLLQLELIWLNGGERMKGSSSKFLFIYVQFHVILQYVIFVGSRSKLFRNGNPRPPHDQFDSPHPNDLC